MLLPFRVGGVVRDGVAPVQGWGSRERRGWIAILVERCPFSAVQNVLDSYRIIGILRHAPAPVKGWGRCMSENKPKVVIDLSLDRVRACGLVPWPCSLLRRVCYYWPIIVGGRG